MVLQWWRTGGDGWRYTSGNSRTERREERTKVRGCFVFYYYPLTGVQICYLSPECRSPPSPPIVVLLGAKCKLHHLSWYLKTHCSKRMYISLMIWEWVSRSRLIHLFQREYDRKMGCRLVLHTSLNLKSLVGSQLGSKIWHQDFQVLLHLLPIFCWLLLPDLLVLLQDIWFRFLVLVWLFLRDRM